MIDQTLVKEIMGSSVLLGLDKSDTSKKPLNVYNDHFEALFISTTEKYYKTVFETFLAIKGGRPR